MIKSRAKYQSKWRKDNPEKVKKYSDKYLSNPIHYEERLERSRNNYQKNKEKISQRRKEIREKDQERFRNYANKWYSKHKEEVKQRRKERIEKLKIIIGSKCVICGKEPKRIIFHEIHGKEHPCTENYQYVFENAKDFVSICQICHRALHYFGKNLEPTIKLLSELQK